MAKDGQGSNVGEERENKLWKIIKIHSYGNMPRENHSSSQLTLPIS
jgi:hypothetical protein